jgi:tRNA nucleotidyltransferase (CCA-adding enzyme)
MPTLCCIYKYYPKTHVRFLFYRTQYIIYMIKHRVSAHIRKIPSGHRVNVRSYLRGDEMRKKKLIIAKIHKLRLPTELISGRNVIQILHTAGYEGYIVGGATRDFIMGNPIHDVDITTNATPQEVMQLFKINGYRAIPTGEEFGTITVIYDGKPYEITTYRSEGKYSDSRHPELVKWEKDIEKDLSRRDFTINAIAFDPFHDKFIDPYGGRADIKNHILRAVGNPNDRFKDDPLRMMRFIRFAGRYGIKTDPATTRAVRRQRKLLTKIPRERVRDELIKILESDDPTTSLRLMVDTGLAEQFIPEISRLKDMKQNPLHHKYDVLTHTLKTVEYLPKEKPILRLAGLLHDIEKPSVEHAHLGKIKVERIADELKLSKTDKDYLVSIVEHHMDMFNYNKKITPRDVRRYINRHQNEAIVEDLALFNVADIKASGTPRERIYGTEFVEALKEVRTKKEPTGVASLKVRGEDVMAYGFRGPEVGNILKILAEDVIENPANNNREYLIRRIKELTLS